jgi:hypothetical protein
MWSPRQVSMKCIVVPAAGADDHLDQPIVSASSLSDLLRRQAADPWRHVASTHMRPPTSDCPSPKRPPPTSSAYLDRSTRLQLAPTATSTAQHAFSSRRHQRHQRCSTLSKLSVIFNSIFLQLQIFSSIVSDFPCLRDLR